MRTSFAFAFACLAAATVAACASNPLTSGGGDGSVSGNPDLTVAGPPDLRATTCAELHAAVQQYLANNRSCSVDADCTTTFTQCGLPGVCGSYVAKSAPAGTLAALVDAWTKQGCTQGQPCPDCAQPLPPACIAGTCGPRKDPGAIGDPCTSGSQCLGGECLLAPQWPDGYCTMFDCDILRFDCPTGSSCRPTFSDNRHACLKDCNPFIDVVQCRNGYGCCPGAGPATNPSWCYPQQGACLNK